MIGIKEIMVLTGCSDAIARDLRIQALKSYDPIFKVANVDQLGLRTKVRLDKFLDFYNDEVLIELYKRLWLNE